MADLVRLTAPSGSVVRVDKSRVEALTAQGFVEEQGEKAPTRRRRATSPKE